MKLGIEHYDTKPVEAVCYDALWAASGPRIIELLVEAEALATGPAASAPSRFERLIDIAEGLSKAVTPHTPCKDACSHCCHMAVAISDIEAEAISRYTGKAITRPKGYIDLDTMTQGMDDYAGVACPFLVEAKCSIYPVRPIACRTHHNLAANSDNCRLTGVETVRNTVSLNFMLVEGSAVQVGMQMGSGFGDIRTYF